MSHENDHAKTDPQHQTALPEPPSSHATQTPTDQGTSRDRMIRGYASEQGILTGPETRASSPVRITRDDATRQSRRVAGLYPVGEGAGYSGGIMSSATDGLKSAEQIIAHYAPPQ